MDRVQPFMASVSMPSHGITMILQNAIKTKDNTLTVLTAPLPVKSSINVLEVHHSLLFCFSESQKQLAAFLSFFQINLGTIYSTDKPLQCDCNLFDLKMFIGTQQARAPVSLLSGSKYLHTLLLSFTNFQTWKCQVNPILVRHSTVGSFLAMDNKNFICLDKNLICPPKCTCYKGANDYRLIIDCSNRSLHSFPENITMPEGLDELILNLDYNFITALPDCDDIRYEWLKQLNHLSLQHNEIAPEKFTSFDKFLRCMPKITHLSLAYNNIVYFPPSISRMDFQALSISGNKLTCCGAEWMKKWLQEKNETIRDSLTVHCADFNMNKSRL